MSGAGMPTRDLSSFLPVPGTRSFEYHAPGLPFKALQTRDFRPFRVRWTITTTPFLKILTTPSACF